MDEWMYLASMELSVVLTFRRGLLCKYLASELAELLGNTGISTFKY